MDDSDGSSVADALLEVAQPSAAEAFAAVGNETRLAILQALWDAEGTVTFSDLRRRVGIADSAQFNYHLRQLTDRFVRHDYALTIDGVCPVCNGRMETTFDPAFLLSEGEPDECSIPPEFGVAHRCVQCDGGLKAAVGMCLLDAPVVVEFYRDHGVDLREKRYWELPWAMGHDTTLVSEDPLRVAVELSVDGDRLRVVVDESLSVVEATLTPAN